MERGQTDAAACPASTTDDVLTEKTHAPTQDSRPTGYPDRNTEFSGCHLKGTGRCAEKRSPQFASDGGSGVETPPLGHRKAPTWVSRPALLFLGGRPAIIAETSHQPSRWNYAGPTSICYRYYILQIPQILQPLFEDLLLCSRLPLLTQSPIS